MQRIKTILFLASLGFYFSAIQPVSAVSIRPKYGPPESPRAVPLAKSFDFFQSRKGANPGFWALISHYVPQMNEHACSAATLATVLNAAREQLKQTSTDLIITQESLLNTVPIENWKKRLTPGGDEGKYGVTLDQFGKIARYVFRKFGFLNASVQVVHVETVDDDKKNELQEVLSQLSEKDFLVANFDQGIFTDDESAGHFSPIGAYDPDRKRVLILDAYRSLYEPYWVSLDTFMKGMATKDQDSKVFRGYTVIRTN